MGKALTLNVANPRSIPETQYGLPSRKVPWVQRKKRQNETNSSNNNIAHNFSNV